jgi:hypothetical protein
MDDVVGQSLWIAFKIWFFAIVFNTILGIISIGFMISFDEFMFAIIIFGAFWAAIFSIPIAFVLLILLMVLSQQQYRFAKTMLIIYSTGIIGSVVVSWLFFQRYGEFNFLYVTASLSGAIAILTQTKAIRKLTQRKNIVDELLKPDRKEAELI